MYIIGDTERYTRYRDPENPEEKYSLLTAK